MVIELYIESLQKIIKLFKVLPNNQNFLNKWRKSLKE
jgi:hypothetical protein